MGEDFDAVGHLSRSVFEEVGVPREAEVYLCGPTRFMAEMQEALATYPFLHRRQIELAQMFARAHPRKGRPKKIVFPTEGRVVSRKVIKRNASKVGG
jgi:ferredoxin-NADP reductase